MKKMRRILAMIMTVIMMMGLMSVTALAADGDKSASTVRFGVKKSWAGDTAETRPQNVTVTLYADGEAVEGSEIQLNAENNWSYTWPVDEGDAAKWTVVERTVKDPYEVAIRKNGATFSIVNTWQEPGDIPPTGDSFALLPMLLLAGLSGVMLLLLGLRSRRGA